MKIAECKEQIGKYIDERIAWIYMKCFPTLKILVVILNGLVGLSGSLTVLTAIFLYIVPKFHLFIDALKNVFSVHSIFGSLMIIGLIMTLISFAGLYYLRKNEYEKLGLQGASFLMLLIVMVAIMFTFWVEWESNAHFAMSYATQSYTPNHKKSKYFESIQSSMHCCGSKGPKDFDIGNEYFKMKTVPISCCNFLVNPEICSQKSNINNTGKGSLSIPTNLAFQDGCIRKMETIIWPTIVGIIACQMFSALLCMIITSVLCVGYSSYIAKDSRSDDDIRESQLLTPTKYSCKIHE